MLGFALFMLIIVFIVFGIVYILSSPFNFYKTGVSYLLFILCAILICGVGVGISVTHTKAVEMCKMKCPYYNSWSTPEKFEVYNKCADICENGQSIFEPRKRKGF